MYRTHNFGSGRTRIRTFFSNQDPAGTGSGQFFKIKIRPEPGPDFFFQIRIRPEPDPDIFFKLKSGRIRTRTLTFVKL